MPEVPVHENECNDIPICHTVVSHEYDESTTYQDITVGEVRTGKGK
jgi:hypothetical protein